MNQTGEENGNTDVHESGHLMGWFDGIMNGSRVTHDYKGKMASEEPCVIQPGVMTPAKYDGSNPRNEFYPFSSDYLDVQGSVDPKLRANPDSNDVSKLGVKWNDLGKSRKLGIGSTTKWFWHKDGTRK